MKVWLASLIAALFLALPVAAAETSDPAVGTVQTFYDALLASMKDGKTLGSQGRYEKMRPAVDQAFDFNTMIRFAAGPGFDQASPADQKALTDAFARMTAAQYAGNFDSFHGEQFVVDPTVQIRGSDHYVSSKLVTPSQTVTFTYRLRQFGSNWKIIDILLEGSISQLSVYRSDYNATMTQGGAPALMKKIDALADKALKS